MRKLLELKLKKLTANNDNNNTNSHDENNNNNDAETVKRVEQPEEADLLSLPYEVLHDGIGTYLTNPKDMAHASRSCTTLHNFFQPDLDKLVLKQLLQSVVDDDRETVKRILDAKPELLLQGPKIKEGIESQKTWQWFHVEKPLEMALKRGQLEMVKLMLPYFKKLENGKAEALAQWKVREISEQEKEQYALKMKALIDVIAKESFPNGTEEDRLIDRISEETKAALEAFRKELLPDIAITLDVEVQTSSDSHPF